MFDFFTGADYDCWRKSRKKERREEGRKERKKGRMMEKKSQEKKEKENYSVDIFETSAMRLAGFTGSQAFQSLKSTLTRNQSQN